LTFCTFWIFFNNPNFTVRLTSVILLIILYKIWRFQFQICVFICVFLLKALSFRIHIKNLQLRIWNLIQSWVIFGWRNINLVHSLFIIYQIFLNRFRIYNILWTWNYCNFIFLNRLNFKFILPIWTNLQFYSITYLFHFTF